MKAKLWLAVLVLALGGLVISTSAEAITFRAAASTDVNGSSLTLTINVPIGTVQGDVMIAGIAVRPSTATITAPAGWTLVRRQDNALSVDNSLAVYYKFAGASEPASYTWTLDSTNTGNAGGISSFSGVEPANPINVQAGSSTAASTNNFPAPIVTTTAANTMVVTHHAYASSTRWFPPTGMTEAVTAASLAVNNSAGEAIEGNYVAQASIAAIGPFTATLNLSGISPGKQSGYYDNGNMHTLVLNPACPAVSDAGYVAANAQSGQATVYWSSPNPVLILQKTAPFASEAPTNYGAYTVGATIGTASVVYVGSVPQTSFTQTGLTNGTYYYKVFVNAGGCYSPGTGVVARPASGVGAPSWSYALAGGSILKGGTAGTGTIYATSNASRIVGLNTADGTQSWAPVATNAPIQGWLTWLPVGSAAGSGQSSVLGADLPLAANTARVYLADVTAGSTSWPVLPSLPPTGWNSTGLPGADQFLAAPAAQMGAYSNATFQAAYRGGISFAAVANANAGAVSSLTYALTIPAGGTNRFLLVSVGLGTTCTGTTPTISGITYAGVALTRITSIVGTPCGSNQTRSEQWGLVAPATGTNNVVVTLSAAGTTIHSGAMAFTGVGQTTPVRAFASASGAGTSSTVTVTSAVGDLVVNTVGQGTSITAPGSGQTQRYLNNVSSGNTLDNDAGSTAPGAASSVTMTWTFGASDQWQTISSSLQPSGAGSVIFAATGNTLTYIAVGPTKNNQVFALDASTGAVLWTFSPGTMDGVQGMPWVDYARNRIYVTSCDGSVDCKSGTQQTLWVIKTVTDSEGTQGQAMICPACTTPKGIKGSPTLSYDGLTLYVGDNAGTLYAINAGPLTLKWSLALTPAGTTVVGFVWEDYPPNTGRLYFAASDGTVRCIQDTGTSGAACTGWASPLPSVPGPSTPLLLNKLFVGSWNGTLGQIYQICANTPCLGGGSAGSIEKQVTVGDGTKQPGDVSTETGNEIFIGTTEGVIYKFPLTSGSL